MSQVPVIRLRRGDDTVTVNVDDVATQSTFLAEGWAIEGEPSIAAQPADSGKPKTRILDPRALPTIVVRKGLAEFVVNATEEAKWTADGWAVVGEYQPPIETAKQAKQVEKRPGSVGSRVLPTVTLWFDGECVVVNDTEADRAPWLAQGYGEDPQTMSVERAAKLAAEAAEKAKAEAERLAAEAEANAKKKGK